MKSKIERLEALLVPKPKESLLAKFYRCIMQFSFKYPTLARIATEALRENQKKKNRREL